MPITFQVIDGLRTFLVQCFHDFVKTSLEEKTGDTITKQEYQHFWLSAFDREYLTARYGWPISNGHSSIH